jgi:hypothetical protein
MTTMLVADYESLHTHAPPSRRGCRFCGSFDRHSVIDLGMSPPSENFLTAEQLDAGEMFYPLHAFVCGECFLVQVDEYVSGREIFGGEYAYFSS